VGGKALQKLEWGPRLMRPIGSATYGRYTLTTEDAQVVRDRKKFGNPCPKP